MTAKSNLAGWVVFAAVLGGTLVVVHRVQIGKRPGISLSGAVIRQDPDPRKEVPIADVEIEAANGLAASDCLSDSSGFFRLTLRAGLAPGQRVSLLFRHPKYESQEVNAVAGNEIYVIRMAPISHQVDTTVNRPEVVIANVAVRYSIKTRALVNVGSVVKTFQVVNSGDVPCNGRRPCSPDGRWKAATGSISLDAGKDGEFRNARASCIGGPCPFTRIDPPEFSQDRRVIKVSALDWSDTTTFLLEAEVARSMVSNAVRQSYPVTFGESLNFTLPVGAEGVSFEAELNGAPIVFPLGPNLILSWANCSASVNRDQTQVYRCELKSGYRFQ
jgi:hypothetical protein